jgi:hypothetical protein
MVRAQTIALGARVFPKDARPLHRLTCPRYGITRQLHAIACPCLNLDICPAHTAVSEYGAHDAIALGV